MAQNPLAPPVVRARQSAVPSHSCDIIKAGWYYWLSCPQHPYDVKCIPDFDSAWVSTTRVQSLEHLRWGLYRLYVDGLLYFGNIRTAYRFLRSCNWADLEQFFRTKRFDTQAMID